MFQSVCLAALDLFNDDPQHEFTVLGRIVDAFGPGVCVVALTGASNVLAEAFSSYLAVGNVES